MSWHVCESAKRGRFRKKGVMVRSAGGIFQVIFTPDVADAAGWSVGGQLVIEVGSGGDCGLFQLRPARPGETGMTIHRENPRSQRLQIKRVLREWFLPPNLGRVSTTQASRWTVSDGAVTFAVPGALAARLREAQAAAGALEQRRSGRMITGEEGP